MSTRLYNLNNIYNKKFLSLEYKKQKIKSEKEERAKKRERIANRKKKEKFCKCNIFISSEA